MEVSTSRIISGNYNWLYASKINKKPSACINTYTFSYRNTYLNDRGIKLPKATSTGTTIVGCLFKDGVVLGADTRATEGEIVADKNCEKVCSLLHLIDMLAQCVF